MATNLADHQQIKAVKTVSGNTPKTAAVNEGATQTFKNGAPVQLTAGNVAEWDGATIARGILGVALQDGSNYASAGLGAPPAFGSVGSPGTSSTFGAVPYQTSAKNIAHGAPMADGRTMFELADEDTIFEAQVDNNAFAVAADATTVQADIGTQFGLTKDASGHWYIDRGKVTVGTNTVAVIVALHPNDGSKLNGRVWFKFIKAVQSMGQ